MLRYDSDEGYSPSGEVEPVDLTALGRAPHSPALDALAVGVCSRGVQMLWSSTCRGSFPWISSRLSSEGRRVVPTYLDPGRLPEMADERAVYEAIAQAMRDYGYREVTAAVVREIDEGPPTEERRGVVAMFAGRQLQTARESGLLPPVAAGTEPPQRSSDVG